MNLNSLIILAVLIPLFISCQDRTESPLHLLSNQIPTDSALVFGKGKISTEAFEFAITFSPEMDELFFTRRKPDADNEIFTSKLIDGTWTTPQLAFFTPNEGWDFEPHINPTGDKLYFGSVRPHPDSLYPGGLYQWVSERTSDGWSQPIPLEAPFDNRFVMYLTSSATGNLYFTSMEEDAKMEDGGIYYSKAEGEDHKEVSRMGNAINFQGKWIAHPYIAPDESYIIYDGEKESGFGENDLYISFNVNSNWSEAYNLGPVINTELTEMCASVSPDGKYLFFHRGGDDHGDIYWVDFRPIKESLMKNININ
jgi:Tol biopolymer transport system component